jgi:prophage regulatory protein
MKTENNSINKHGKSLRPKQAAEFLGIGRSTLYRYMDRDDFPKPSQLSKRCIVFDMDALASWRDAQKVA